MVLFKKYNSFLNERFLEVKKAFDNANKKMEEATALRSKESQRRNIVSEQTARIATSMNRKAKKDLATCLRIVADELEK